MRIAIIGAGLSGLACAHRLEQLGFGGTVDLFEERSDIGTGNVFLEFTAELFHRPVRDIFAYYAERYKLYLQPLHTTYQSFNYGPTRATRLKGFLGQVIVRGGDHPLALERQLYEQIKTKVKFNQRVRLEEIRGDYDIVVLATGNLADVPEAIGVRVDRYAHFRHGIIRGEFDTQSLKFWFNNRYAPDGYSYLLPLDEQRAMLSVVTPNREYLTEGWKRLEREVFSGSLDILDSLHEVNNLPIGQPTRLRQGNVIFAGNTAGAITPAMGYGLHVAILTGLYAAEAIVNGRDYEQLMQQHLREYRWSLALRNAIEALNQDQLDTVIDGMDSFIGRQLLRAGGPNFLRMAGRVLSLVQNETKKSAYPRHLLKYDGETVSGSGQSEHP